MGAAGGSMGVLGAILSRNYCRRRLVRTSDRSLALPVRCSACCGLRAHDSCARRRRLLSRVTLTPLPPFRRLLEQTVGSSTAPSTAEVR